MNRTKRFGTVLLCGAMIASVVFSSTGCTFLDKYTEEKITKTADKFCKSICNLNPDPASRCVIDEDAAEFFTEYTFASDPDEQIVFEAIADSLSYELDTDSVEINHKSGKCSIDAEFDMTDYEKVFDTDTFFYPEDFSEAIKAGKDTIEIEVTLEFEKDEYKEWKIANYEDVMEEVFEFKYYAPEYEIKLSDYLVSCQYESGNNINISYIYYILTFSEDLPDTFSSGYCEVKYNNTDVGTIDFDITYSDLYDSDSKSLTVCPIAYIDSSDIYDSFRRTEDGSLVSGTYTFNFYMDDGSFITTGTVIVNYVAPTPTPSPTPTPVTTVVGDSWSHAADVFEERGASYEPTAESLDIQFADWELYKDNGNGDGSVTLIDSHLASDVDFMIFIVDTPEPHEYDYQMFCFSDPSTPVTYADAGEAIEASVNYTEYNNLYSVSWIIADPEPGVYVIYIFSDDVDAGEHGQLVVTHVIEIF